MTQATNSERRRFQRIPFDHNSHVLINQRPEDCQLLDISLKGALLKYSSNEHPLKTGDQLELVVSLDDEGELQIRMQGEVTHREGDHVGIRCLEMDLDSATELRRLVEVNLGDAQMLERELAAMINPG